jgi:hypothetical protein
MVLFEPNGEFTILADEARNSLDFSLARPVRISAMMCDNKNNVRRSRFAYDIGIIVNSVKISNRARRFWGATPFLRKNGVAKNMLKQKPPLVAGASRTIFSCSSSASWFLSCENCFLLPYRSLSLNSN